MMARPKLNLLTLDPASGKPRPYAWVTIYPSNTLTLATLYADDDISTLANPVQANALGQVAVRVNPGTYDVAMTWDGNPPTVVEDVLAWTPETAILTTPGDLIVGSAGGPTRLAVGAEDEVLLVDGGLPNWRRLASGVGLPVGNYGSILVYGGGGSVQVIAPGVQDQALAMAGGLPTWVSTLLPPGTTLPINQPGDLVTGAVGSGLPSRLPVGPAGHTLTVNEDASGLYWAGGGEVGVGVGQCYLTYVNDYLLALYPFEGRLLWIAGRGRVIPDSGVGLVPTGLALHTNYYIYAAWTGSAIVLEASTTGFVQLNGLWCKAGDSSRTLVGYARVINDVAGNPRWIDQPNSRCVMTLFNQDERVGSGFFTAPRSVSSPPELAVEVHPEIRIFFISWGFANVQMGITGAAWATTPDIGFNSLLALDGVPIGGLNTTAVTPNVSLNIAATITKTLPAQDTLHYVTLMAQVQPGTTVTWWGDAAGLIGCRTHLAISN